MNKIRLISNGKLGTQTVSGRSSTVRPLPPGTKDADWRSLTDTEISVLESHGNRAENWKLLHVQEGFNPELVENCRFYGLVRIGSLSEALLEYNDLKLPVGLYSCTIIACDIGCDVALHSVGYMARMCVESRCILFRVDELVTTDHAKFGNGVVMDEEDESVRIWLEIANESGGRKVLPFDGMLPADAYLWSKYRNDAVLMDRFKQMTLQTAKVAPNQYGRIGEGTVIKECRILKDVLVGKHAYIKGANKLKNLTVNSRADQTTQIGEGCELVNGIIGYGCRIFYGVKAVRFILSDYSSLKYGARLINSILGPNSTISCCEVLNSLLFGAHEQHHNSSFLCASILKGQSNMASAATVGSNHNSRAPDGEIVAERGFWPGLSVSLKHNCRFASFTLLAKGAYPAELNIELPFSLVSNDETAGELCVMPGFWFRYNLYALARNSAKFAIRDARQGDYQEIEYDWLAPDTVDEMRKGRRILEDWARMHPNGSALLKSGEPLELYADDSVENSRRKVRILHAGRAWKDYGRMIRYYAVRSLLSEGKTALHDCFPIPDESAGTEKMGGWENVGGQLFHASDLERLKIDVRKGVIKDWGEMHRSYRTAERSGKNHRKTHVRQVLAELRKEDPALFSSPATLLQDALETASFIMQGIRESRRKDYENPFRNITYGSADERDSVLGSFEENSFIQKASEAYGDFRRTAQQALQTARE